MLEEDKLAIDESRKIAQHEEIKGKVRAGIHREIESKAELDQRDQAAADRVADELKRKAVREVLSTESEIDRTRGLARVSQVVDYVFYLIYGVITLEIVLGLIGASPSNAFRNLIETLASPFLAPFRGLVSDPGTGPFTFRLSYLFALIVYLFLHLAINGLLRLLAHRKMAV